jgi:hypothetical protein
VHPRKQGFVLTLKSDRPVSAGRIVKAEQTSSHRWHLDVRVTDACEIDAELLGWIRTAYELCP